MKKFLLILTLVLIGVIQVHSQAKRITGTVTSRDDGSTSPGVTVLIKGTTIGTITDLDGKYSIDVPEDAQILVFSYVGMKTVEVPISGRTLIDLVMEPDMVGIDEVVVTAIGIRRDEKSLGYSATQVKSDDITKSRQTSLMNSLQGKVAGVVITSSSGAPGASTKVILRGYTSIGGNNQPLYVIDGVPIDNTGSGNSMFLDNNSATRSQDFGNRANDINPDDVESMTILKGASATALYGSRAASGVIMITTKSGQNNKKLNVSISTSATTSAPVRLPRLQNMFGQGWNGLYDLTQNGSWGPMYDGRDRLWGNVVNNSQMIKPYVVQADNVKDFYDRGIGYNNSIALSGGNDRATFYASYSNVKEDGIIPTDADSYRRHNLSFRGSANGKRISSSFSVNYVKKDMSFVTTGQGATDGGATLFQELIQIPRDISIVDLKDYHNVFNNIDNYYTSYADNPYRVINENGNRYNEDRVYGNLKLDYKILSDLTATMRVGTDIANSQLLDWGAIARSTPGSTNSNRARTDYVGRVNQRVGYNRELNADFLLTYNRDITPDFTLNALVGYNANEHYKDDLYAYVSELTIPGFYNIHNSPNSPVINPPAVDNFGKNINYTEKRRLYGAYGQLDLGYKNILFLTANARNDWSSTLPEGKNSYFYPGINASFVISELIPNIERILPFAKLRASWGKTGKDADPYSIFSVMTASQVYLPFGNIQFPMGGISAFEVSNQLGNRSLKPELTTEYEFGTDLRFFENRLGIDLAYYNRTTVDQLYAVPLAISSGYTTKVMNFGKVENKGIELLTNIVPVRTKDFTWSLTYTYTRNRNKVLELTEGLDRITIQNGYEIDFVAIKNYPIGVFMGPRTLKDDQGHTVVNSNGIPVVEIGAQDTLGTAEPKFIMGLTNTLKYKGFTLAFTLDWRYGGKMYSYTKELNYFVGNATNTLYNYRQPFIVPNSVMQVLDEDGNPFYAPNNIPVDINNFCNYFNQQNNTPIEQDFVIDRTYVKLREMTLSYSVPKKLFEKAYIEGIELGLYGRNLLVWTPAENDIIDPELSTFGNDLSGDFGEWAAGPTVRSFGFSAKVNF
ncbi:MAG: SusC/RagA family TonB-linked outer membrane protein [Bacteroidales bacterium]